MPMDMTTAVAEATALAEQRAVQRAERTIEQLQDAEAEVELAVKGLLRELSVHTQEQPGLPRGVKARATDLRIALKKRNLARRALTGDTTGLAD